VIEVRDNGAGIPAEHAEKVYEPYFTSKPEGKGTGIGLYMSKLIVEESMGGRLSFTSSGQGTVFRIELAGSGGDGPWMTGYGSRCSTWRTNRICATVSGSSWRCTTRRC